MAALLVTGKVNEAAPIAGKPGLVTANVKFAHDADKLYVHLEFAEGNQPDAKQDAKFATKVSLMLAKSGKVPEADRAGCWGACHDDLTNMPSAAGATRTKYLGQIKGEALPPGRR